eukprot:SAG31_NODE_367_length_16811_cov_20.811584_17_plen_186_part_00
MPGRNEMRTVELELDDSFISAEQRNHFNYFGYLKLADFFTASEAQRMSREFNETIDGYIDPPFASEDAEQHRARVEPSKGAGEKHDGSKRTMIGGPIEHKMHWILDHPRISGLLGGLIGKDWNYCSGDGNYYSGDTQFHPDGNWGQLFAVKIAFYLDALDATTGAASLCEFSATAVAKQCDENSQ